jgi:hypothetical protein
MVGHSQMWCVGARGSGKAEVKCGCTCSTQCRLWLLRKQDSGPPAEGPQRSREIGRNELQKAKLSFKPIKKKVLLICIKFHLPVPHAPLITLEAFSHPNEPRDIIRSSHHLVRDSSRAKGTSPGAARHLILNYISVLSCHNPPPSCAAARYRFRTVPDPLPSPPKQLHSRYCLSVSKHFMPSQPTPTDKLTQPWPLRSRLRDGSSLAAPISPLPLCGCEQHQQCFPWRVLSMQQMEWRTQSRLLSRRDVVEHGFCVASLNQHS